MATWKLLPKPWAGDADYEPEELQWGLSRIEQLDDALAQQVAVLIRESVDEATCIDCERVVPLCDLWAYPTREDPYESPICKDCFFKESHHAGKRLLGKG